MTVAVLAEKPSVARDIARVLGAKRRGQGCLEGNGYVVTWAIGHLVALAEPHQIRAEWKRWSIDLLPMLPESWPLVVYEKTREQFDVVSRILTDPGVDRVVCATDAGREGELIFRYIYESSSSTKPVHRLWISSLTEEAIRDGFAHLRDGANYDALADAARGRSRADWLVGMNLSRAYSVALGETLSVGRVQTPTLAMLVDRELAIRAFVAEDYKEVVATFRPRGPDRDPDDHAALTYEGVFFREGAKKGEEVSSTSRRLPPDGKEAERIVARATTGEAGIESVEARRRRARPPELYDLTELQRRANRLYGFSAKKTLDVAQSLYERKKLISYPRTDSRFLSSAVEATLGSVVAAIAGRYPGKLASGAGERPLGKRFVNDARVTDHHAIVPTVTKPDQAALSSDEEKIYDLVCRRLLAAWHDDHLYSTTMVVTTILNRPNTIDRYRSTGKRVDRTGWKVLEPDSSPREKSSTNEEQELPSNLAARRPVEVVDAKSVDKQTRPPRRFTDATLLTAMETAGKTLDEKELSHAMRENGLGTPATRAAIIETLLQRKYVEREKKLLVATDKGIRLIEVVHPEVKSPVMTGKWEAELQAIHRGSGRFDAFMRGIEGYVRDVVERLRRQGGSLVEKKERSVPAKSSAPRRVAASVENQPSVVPRTRTPTSPDDIGKLLHRDFGFREFRPYQEAVCRAMTQGDSVLLVMPTGAGKSLCYQLPGVARAGTTLVVSPLIALMEDQVAGLVGQGFRAERIHSGRSRLDSRQVCQEYLDGVLDFLFIAPERLAVPGFAEMLARRRLALIAVDEAHCISHWGHDFRPDYRMLKERLPLLRDETVGGRPGPRAITEGAPEKVPLVPVIGLTATATPLVQNDIVGQLGIHEARRFIHGFRRTNIGIEVVEMPPSARAAATEKLLVESGNRPAIVYAPTRKQCEALACRLDARFPTAAYHAGITPSKRDAAQASFLAGEVEVIVATIAFGMGIDKPNVRTVIHTALPGSIESYYQEIGRAGRDGKPSRAVLLESYADRRTHEYFLERDYPEPAVLRSLYEALPAKPQPRARLASVVRMDSDRLMNALEKLWIHGGALMDPEENVARGSAKWEDLYVEQRNHKKSQLDQISRYAGSRDCRMLGLVRHFGDLEDGGQNCGSCDICRPRDSIAIDFREPTATEQSVMRRILESLDQRNGQSAGRLHREEFGESVERRFYENMLTALVRAGLVYDKEDNFESDGRTIKFRRVYIGDQRREMFPEGLSSVLVSKEIEVESSGRKRTGRRRKPGRKKIPHSLRESPDANEPPGSPELVEALRKWRLGEARRRRIPAFRILTNRTLDALARAKPTDEESLLAVKGIGPAIVGKYGEEILGILEKGSTLNEPPQSARSSRRRRAGTLGAGTVTVRKTPKK